MFEAQYFFLHHKQLNNNQYFKLKSNWSLFKNKYYSYFLFYFLSFIFCFHVDYCGNTDVDSRLSTLFPWLPTIDV